MNYILFFFRITSLKLTAGQCLSGNIMFAKDENGKKVVSIIVIYYYIFVLNTIIN